MKREAESSPQFKGSINALARCPEFGLARHDAIFDHKPIGDDFSDVPMLANSDLFEVEFQFGRNRDGLRVP